METNDLNYFKQKIYEISRVPKSSLEEDLDDVPILKEDAKVEYRFEKFIEHLIKNKTW